MPPRPLRPGSKVEFVSRHLALTNDEIAEKAKAEGLSIKAKQLDTLRWYLRTKYGKKNTGSKARKLKGTKRKYTARAAKVEPKRKYTRRADKESNGVSPERKLKHAALRKLVFELGYDEAAEVFGEFQEMHGRWS